MRFDPWAAVSCGQNLEPDGLSAAAQGFSLGLCGEYGECRFLSKGRMNMRAVEKCGGKVKVARG
jgi:hypothetical protein